MIAKGWRRLLPAGAASLVLTALLWSGILPAGSRVLAGELGDMVNMGAEGEDDTTYWKKKDSGEDEQGAKAEHHTDKVVINGKSYDVDYTLIIEYMDMLMSMSESKEMEDLYRYAQDHVEVQDLLNTLAYNLLQLVKDDRALVRKILVTLEVDDIYLSIFETFADAVTAADQFVENAEEEPQFQALVDTVSKYVGKDEAKEYIRQLFAALTGPERRDADPSDLEKMTEAATE